MKKALVVLAVLVLALAGGLFALVNGRVLPKLTNTEPGRFELTYVAARWIPPASVEVDGLELKIQTDGFRFRILAEHASGSFVPLEMLRRRVAFTDITARGVAVFVRLPADSHGTTEARLPMMDDFAPAAPPSGPIFSVELSKLTDVQVDEVWIDGFRYRGDINVSGGFTLEPKQTLTIHPAVVALDGGTVTMPSGTEATLEPSRITARLDGMPLDVPLHQSMFRMLDGDVKLGLTAPNLNFFNTILLEDVPAVRLLYGAGAVSLNVGLQDGVITPGSEVIIAPRAIGVRVPYFDIVGKASMVVKANEGTASATLSIPDFELDLRDEDAKVATGKAFELTATASTLDLTEVRHVDVRLSLGSAHAPNLRFLDRFIPAGSGLIVVSGSGQASVEASLSTKTQKAKGKLSLKASNLELRNRSASIGGVADVTAVLDSLDLKRGGFDLRGSHATLTGVTVKTKQTSHRNVTLSMVANRALFAPKTDHPWAATVTMGASNLQPLVGIVSANIALPGILVGLLNVPDVSASADLDVLQKSVRLVPMSLTGKGLQVDARIRLDETTTKDLEPHGVAFVKLGILTTGLDIDGGIVTPIILGAPQWFEKQVENGVP
ncbi:MAG TPA: hypothetical protein VGD87_03165 [Archangium sp.]